MKKIISSLLLALWIFSILPVQNLQADNNYFIVTAYYSPLPDQKYYITGSYESEIRLNGKGIAWASGKNVFSGMLAAPSKYAFWTKIYLEWLWVWSVEDRGGAIVPAGKRGYSHDRIDIWVWSGDEGLRRAMYWGKRKIAWNVLSATNTTLDYKTIPAPSWAVPKTTTLYGKAVQVEQSSTATKKELDIFSLSLWKWSDTSYISKLQEILLELGYYTTQEITWVYDTHTIDAVYNFQVNNNILTHEYEKWAGSYGPKTRSKLKEIYWLYTKEQEELKEFQETIAGLKAESQTLTQKRIDALWNIQYGDISPEVRELQKILSELWYFKYKDTAIFGVKTQNALIDFQLSNSVISGNDSLWVGVFWPKTRSTIIEELSKIHFEKVLKLEWLLEKYNELTLDTSKEINNDVSREEETIRLI